MIPTGIRWSKQRGFSLTNLNRHSSFDSLPNIVNRELNGINNFAVTEDALYNIQVLSVFTQYKSSVEINGARRSQACEFDCCDK